MKISKSILIALVIIMSVTLIIAGYFYQKENSPLPPASTLTDTGELGVITTDVYLELFDPHRYELAGADYFNPRYSLSRLNKPIDQIDITFDYPFDYLDRVTARLAHVDRRQALKSIFEKVTNGATTNLERHLAVLKFLQKASFHNQVQPMYSDGQAVFDPLILLEVGEMRCGAVARLGVDLFEAVGYKGRLVQAAEHVSAEIYYDEDWHLFEADLSGGLPLIINGRVPSLQQLALNPYLVDRIPSVFEIIVGPIGNYMPLEPYKYRSYYYFSNEELGSVKEAYYYKTASESEAAASKWYGWNYYRAESNRWPLTKMKPKYQPDSPVYKSVKVSDGMAVINWRQSNDQDKDLLGYRVYVSTYSRGWNYRDKNLDKNLEKYVLNSWKPEMYDNMYVEPPSDIGIFERTEPSIEITVPKGSVRYITVMAFDKHGESVGKRLYNMSPELAITGQ